MAGEGSVAPKERINIVFKPASGGAQEEVELPLKLVFMGDYLGREDDRAVEDRKPISVDKDNFNDVMRSQKLSLYINVPNKLSNEDDEMSVNVKFDTLRDFEPENLARQIPELNKLLELRQALTALKGPLGNVPAFRRKLQEIVLDEKLREKLLNELDLEESSAEEK